MTAPKEREEIQSLYIACAHDSIFPFEDGDKETQRFVRHSDHLRHLKLAQIVVLEEMAKELCEYCGRKLPFAPAHPYDGNTLFHDNEEGSVWNCWYPEIHTKIAALRKELEG